MSTTATVDRAALITATAASRSHHLHPGPSPTRRRTASRARSRSAPSSRNGLDARPRRHEGRGRPSMTPRSRVAPRSLLRLPLEVPLPANQPPVVRAPRRVSRPHGTTLWVRAGRPPCRPRTCRRNGIRRATGPRRRPGRAQHPRRGRPAPHRTLRRLARSRVRDWPAAPPTSSPVALHRTDPRPPGRPRPPVPAPRLPTTTSPGLSARVPSPPRQRRHRPCRSRRRHRRGAVPR